MAILDTQTTRERVRDLVHFDTQESAVGLDLTVDAVARVTGRGALDFGGSEFRPADREFLEPELADSGDDYGWWELEAGSYVVRYNEALDAGAGTVGVVHPLPRLQQAGAFHPAFIAEPGEAPLETLVSVCGPGCRIKENSRVSRLVLVES
jgi:deoxycytidine triphosphate deaminase